MGSFSDGFFMVIGGFVAVVFILVVLGLIFYFSLKSGALTGLAKGTFKNLANL